MLPSLYQFVLACLCVLAPGRDHTALAGAIRAAVETGIPEPFFKNDVDELVEGVVLPARGRSGALMAAISFRESSAITTKVGDCPGMGPGDPKCTLKTGATSFGAFQLSLPFHHKGEVTGLTGVQLLEDPDGQAREAAQILWRSVHVCPEYPVAWYAHGRDARAACADEHARRVSNDRVWLAKKTRKDAAHFIATHPTILYIAATPPQE